MKHHKATWQRNAFIGVWMPGTVALGWMMMQGHQAFDSPATLPALLILLVCTAALLWWLASAAPDVPSPEVHTRPGRFVLVLVLTVAVLFSLRVLVGLPLLFALPVVGLVVLALLRPRLRLRWLEVVYALLLALIAGVAGLGAGWVTFTPLTWAVLQVALVLVGLLVGWSLLHHTGLWQSGIGRSLLLTDGPVSALGGLAQGALIALPWAIGLVLLGSADSETWVRHWWQPLLAIQPAIAEEAWGRVLLVPLLFLIFRPAVRGRTALTVAMVVAAYWFAYLHTSGGFEAILSTVLIGTLFVLPTSYLWLRRGLERAIGFHFVLDFVKFLVAFLST